MPLSYHTENVKSESDGGNRWLLFKGPKKDCSYKFKMPSKLIPDLESVKNSLIISI